MPTETYTAGQDFTVPDGVFSIDLELEGEAGETANYNGGDGGRVVGDIEVTPGDIIYIRSSIGGSGPSPGAGAGGESIDIRRGGTSLSDRIAVAAGGGGSGNQYGSGAGGADTGEGGNGTGAGSGGTQTAGGAGGTSNFNGEDGSFGPGGDGANTDRAGGGGGAGWYGGGGGGSSGSDFGDEGFGAGGGSNYDDELRSVTANERGTSTRTHGEGGLVTLTYEQTPGAENLTITNTTDTSHTLDWDAPTLPPEVDSVDQYRVYRATAPGTTRGDYTEVATVPAGTTTYDDTGLDNGIEYHYRIGADLFVPEAEYTVTITGFRGV